MFPQPLELLFPNIFSDPAMTRSYKSLQRQMLRTKSLYYNSKSKEISLRAIRSTNAEALKDAQTKCQEHYINFVNALKDFQTVATAKRLRRMDEDPSFYIPYRINLKPLNTVEKRIVTLRPFSVWSTHSLRKSSLRRFLRANKQEYSSKDKKSRLVQRVRLLMRRNQVMYRHFAMRRLARTRAEEARKRQQVIKLEENLNNFVEPPENVKLKPFIPAICKGPHCACIISFRLLTLNISHSITDNEKLQSLVMCGAPELRKELIDHGVEPTSQYCRELLLRQLCTVLRQKSEENHLPADCMVCHEQTSNIFLEPCGHMVSCSQCAPSLSKCPVCEQYIYNKSKIFIMTFSDDEAEDSNIVT